MVILMVLSMMMMAMMMMAVMMMVGVMAMVPTEMSGQTEAGEDLVEMCKKNSKPHRHRLCLCRPQKTQNGIPISYFLQNFLRNPEIDQKGNFHFLLFQNFFGKPETDFSFHNFCKSVVDQQSVTNEFFTLHCL